MAIDSQEPILASWRVSDVLRRYPALLETLIGLSPAFAHLRNPLVRKVQTRLVTVAQAAQVAGLEPATFVRTLNAAAGLTPAPEMASSHGDDPAGVPAETFERAVVAADLDVRPALARGEEPFGAIMAAVAKVGPGQLLRLRAGFEPAPLYDVLGGRGFAHRARQLGPEEWEVLFLKTSEAPEALRAGHAGLEPTPPPATARAGLAAAATRDAETAAPSADGEAERPARRSGHKAGELAELTIDVSDLAPPEPMVRILEACAQLAPGQTLRVEHARRPIFLYPRLDDLGFAHETRELGPGRVELRIHKSADIASP